MDLEVESENTRAAWSDICQNYAVPKTLHKQQADTITLLRKGENVFCGSPTGSGKTLAQLATVLFTSGCTRINNFIQNLIIPIQAVLS